MDGFGTYQFMFHTPEIIGNNVLAPTISMKCETYNKLDCDPCGCISNIKLITKSNGYVCACQNGLNLIKTGTIRCKRNCSKAKDKYSTGLNSTDIAQCFCIDEYLFNTTLFKCVRNCTKQQDSGASMVNPSKI